MKGNVIIGGAPRSGTTSLYRYLSEHPNIATSQKKEMNYFLGGEFWEDTYDAKKSSKQEYDKQFTESTDSMWSLEASPGYMHPWISNRVSKRISSIMPEAKLIFLLRDPVTRMHSHYNTEKRSLLLNESMNFEEFVNLNFEAINQKRPDNSKKITAMISLEIGCYEKALKDYYDNIQNSNILVVFTENLLANTQYEMKRISLFIGINESFYNEHLFIRENQYHTTKNKNLYVLAGKINQKLEPLLNRTPKVRHYIRKIYNLLNTTSKQTPGDVIDIQVLKKLKNYFTPCNQKLQKLLSSTIEAKDDEVDFPEWLHKG